MESSNQHFVEFFNEISRKLKEVQTLASNANDPHERARLLGKAEGIKLIRDDYSRLLDKVDIFF